MKWTAVSKEWPPIGEWVLTLCANREWPDISSNFLREAAMHGESPGLYYWNSGDDFEDVTHWAPMPPLDAYRLK